MKQWNGSELGKEYVRAVYCHPAYLTYMQSTSWEILEDSEGQGRLVCCKKKVGHELATGQQ